MKQNDSITKASLRCHISWLADELFRLTKVRWGEDSIFDAPAGISGEARPAGGVEGVHGFHQANGVQRTAVSGAFAA